MYFNTLTFRKEQRIFLSYIRDIQYADEPYIGFYKLMRPALIPRDIDLVKDILANDFDCFEDTDSAICKKWDPLLATNPFFVTGHEWSEARKTLVPAFSPNKVIFEIQ